MMKNFGKQDEDAERKADKIKADYVDGMQSEADEYWETQMKFDEMDRKAHEAWEKEQSNNAKYDLQYGINRLEAKLDADVLKDLIERYEKSRREVEAENKAKKKLKIKTTDDSWHKYKNLHDIKNADMKYKERCKGGEFMDSISAEDYQKMKDEQISHAWRNAKGGVTNGTNEEVKESVHPEFKKFLSESEWKELWDSLGVVQKVSEMLEKSQIETDMASAALHGAAMRIEQLVKTIHWREVKEYNKFYEENQSND